MSSAVIFSAVAYGFGKKQTPFSVDFLGFANVLGAIEVSLDREHGTLDTDGALAEQARKVLERQRQAERLTRANETALRLLLLKQSVTTDSAREAAARRNDILHEDDDSEDHEEEKEDIEEGSEKEEAFVEKQEKDVLVDLEDNDEKEKEANERETADEEAKRFALESKNGNDGEISPEAEHFRSEKMREGKAEELVVEETQAVTKRLPFARLITLSTTEAASDIFDLCGALYSNTHSKWKSEAEHQSVASRVPSSIIRIPSRFARVHGESTKEERIFTREELAFIIVRLLSRFWSREATVKWNKVHYDDAGKMIQTGPGDHGRTQVLSLRSYPSYAVVPNEYNGCVWRVSEQTESCVAFCEEDAKKRP